MKIIGENPVKTEKKKIKNMKYIYNIILCLNFHFA